MAMRKKSQLQPLEANFSAVLGMRELSKLAVVSRLKYLWPDLVGPMLAMHSVPVSFDGEKLIVAVDHPAIGHQFRFLYRLIVDVCRDRLNIEKEFKVFTQFEAGVGSTPKEPASPPRKLTLHECKEIARDLQPVSDHALRYALFQARTAQLAAA